MKQKLIESLESTLKDLREKRIQMDEYIKVCEFELQVITSYQEDNA